MVFLEHSAKLLLILHAAAAIVLIGSATHNGILATLHLVGRPRRRVLQKLYARIVFWSYLATFILGLLIYPAFRVHVRAAYLDEHLPLATAFFEIKEHWLGLGLLLLFAYRAMSQRVDIRARSPEARLYHLLGVTLMLTVWLSVFTGLTLVTLRSV